MANTDHDIRKGISHEKNIIAGFAVLGLVALTHTARADQAAEQTTAPEAAPALMVNVDTNEVMEVTPEGATRTVNSQELQQLSNKWHALDENGVEKADSSLAYYHGGIGGGIQIGPIGIGAGAGRGGIGGGVHIGPIGVGAGAGHHGIGGGVHVGPIGGGVHFGPGYHHHRGGVWNGGHWRHHHFINADAELAPLAPCSSLIENQEACY